LNFDEYKTYIVSERADKDTIETYDTAFKTIASGKDFVTEDDLRRSNMPPEKIEFWINNIPRYPTDEVVGYDYKAWLQATHGH